MNDRSFGSLADLFLEIESRCPVHTWKIDGVHVWPIMKFSVARANRAETEVSKSSLSGRTMTQKLCHLAKKVRAKLHRSVLRSATNCLVKDFRHNAVPRRRTVILHTRPTNRRMLRLERFFDEFMDPLAIWLRKLSAPTLTIEEAEGTKYRFPRFGPSIVFDHIRLLVHSIALLLLHVDRLFSRPTIEFAGSDDVLQSLEKNGYRTQGLSPISLHQQICEIRALSMAYRFLYSLVSPRAIIVAGYTNRRSLASTLAAHVRGIPVVDLQHGVHGPPMRWAYAWGRFPSKGYELLPDIYWCWTSNDAAEIDAWPAATEKKYKSFVGGRPFDALIPDKLRQPDNTSRDTVQQIREQLVGCTHILVSLQPEYNDLPFLKEIIQRSSMEWVWWIRFHPRMHDQKRSHKRELGALPNTVFIDEASDCELGVVLNSVDVHLTHSSSVTIEAAVRGIPTVVWSELGSVTFEALTLQSIVFYGESIDRIVNQIQHSIVHREHNGKNANHYS